MARKLTQDEYVKRAQHFGVKVLGEYQGRTIKIKHLCVCGKEWETRPDSVLSGHKCPSCKYIAMRNKFVKPLTQYEEELGVLGVTLVGEYVNTNTKTEHLCSCGRKYIAKPLSVLQGDKCGKCLKNKDKFLKHSDYIDRLKEKEVEVYPVEPYVNMRTKIQHKCVCGNVWLISPLNALYGGLCGCTRSLGELEIQRHLTSQGINFQQEYSFPDLVSTKNRKLRFDFAVFMENELTCLVEYHGEQHYRFIELWHGDKKGFKEAQSRDAQKMEYAIEKEIPLIVIRYDDNTVETLEKGLKRYAKIN